ncbi:MAG: dTDP-glucose 4,6-dehydratase [Vampirovibrionales bacterium]|nr:dTDP-glucose 4,6-dehydratase [Vampirovibrionales bacterium]
MAFTPKHILVTGGAGFIGSWLVKGLIEQCPQAHITTLDALTYAGNVANLGDVMKHGRHSFVQGDIADTQIVQDLFEHSSFDAVINCAAETHVDRSIADATPFLRSNVLGTGVLLEAARKCWQNTPDISRCRFLQVSTDEVYGSIDAPGAFTETSPLAPNSPYSASKAGADLLVQSYGATYGLPVLISRCTNNYGPNQYPEKLLPVIIGKAMAHEPLPIYGDGQNVRDWLHVRDHVRGIITILTHGTLGEVYNIGGNNEWSNVALVRRVLDVLGKPHELMTFVPDRPGHDRRYALDASKLSGQLGWQPMENFQEGLVETIASMAPSASLAVQ